MPSVKIPRWAKACIAVVSVLALANTIVGFFRMRREGQHIFNSNYEMILVLALTVVMLFGVAYKSRQNREHRDDSKRGGSRT